MNIIKKLNSIEIANKDEQDLVIENLFTFLAAGMNVANAIEIIEEDITSKNLKTKIQGVYKQILEGKTLAESLRKYKLLEDKYIALVEIGEKSGLLEKNIKAIIKQKTKEKDFKTKLRTALNYPIFVFAFTIIISIGITWFLLPRLATVFKSINVELPAITILLLNLGDYLEKYGVIVVPIIILLIPTVIYFVFIYKKTKFIGENIIFAIPLFRKLIVEVEVSRMGYTLAYLFKSGISLDEALKSLVNSTNTLKYRRFYEYLTGEIKKGSTFYKSFKKYKNHKLLFPNSVVQMIRVGEESGKLSEMLLKVAKIYEKKSDTATKRLSTMLEPIFLIIVWFGVIFIALAIILPIYSLIGSINDQNNSSPNPNREINIETIETTPTPEIQEEIQEKTQIEEISYPTLTIQETGVGFLNVRNNPNIEGNIVATVEPNETYYYIEESDGWYRIILNKELDTINTTNVTELGKGWVVQDYVEINE